MHIFSGGQRTTCESQFLLFSCSFQGPNAGFRAWLPVHLAHWFPIHVSWPPWGGYMSGILHIRYLRLITVAKLWLRSSNENSFMVGGVTTLWGTVLKCRSTGNAGNLCTIWCYSRCRTTPSHSFLLPRESCSSPFSCHHQASLWFIKEKTYLEQRKEKIAKENDKSGLW